MTTLRLARYLRWVVLGMGLSCLITGVKGEAPTAVISDFEIRNQVMPDSKKRLLRMDVDVTGDGSPELLLALHSRHAQIWSIYCWEGDTHLRFLGEIGFPYAAFLVTADPARLIAPYALEDGRGGIATYEITCSKVVRLSLEDAATPGTPGAEEYAAWRKRVSLKVAAASFTDVLENDSPQWTDALAGKPLAGVGGVRNLILQ